MSDIVNCEDQVRIWISADGLPPKHRARLLRLRVMNPRSHITLVVCRSMLTSAAEKALDAFAGKLDIDVQDIGTIEPADADERLILEHIHAEIRSFAAGAGGNLSVVSDYARLLDWVVRRGLCTDIDVEFRDPLPDAAAAVPCPLGILARFKENGCVSNDVTAGFAQSEPFRRARRNVAALITRYRAESCRYLAASGIDRTVEPDTVSSHPRFFELRNRQADPSLAGTARFSLAGGPDSFAISLHQTGIYCGYESDVTRGREPGELTFDHVPHVMTDGLSERSALRYRPYRFGPTRFAEQAAIDRARLWPATLPVIVSHWDHSWITDSHEWRALTYREHLLLELFDGPDWSPARATPIVRPAPMAPCAAPPTLSSAVAASIVPAPLRSPPTPAHADPHSSGHRPRRTESRGPGGAVWELIDNGIVSVPSLIDTETLTRLHAAFENEITKKAGGLTLQQSSFNLSVDDCETHTLEAFRDVAANPDLVDLLDDYLGGTSRFVSARGYRQGPCKPMRYRAWDYHQDMKTRGPFEEAKVMLLLTDVPPGGQAMRYAAGSHAYHWNCRTQQQTKFTLDEALGFGHHRLSLADGRAGDCVLFDTNGIHSGHRNLSVTRDVITMNFTRASPSAFYMFSNPLLTRSARPADQPAQPARRLEWRPLAVDRDELSAIRREYHDTPSLEETRPSWTGDALGLVDVVVADLNVDLDLRLSDPFEQDRARDIGLVAIRDASLHHVQYARLSRHLGAAGAGHGIDDVRCLWQSAEPLSAAAGIAATARDLLSVRAVGEAAANCAALLDDLCEAVRRCDSVQRLRTTTIFTYFATAWAGQLCATGEPAEFDDRCRELLHFYVDLVAWEDLPQPEQRDSAHA
ncbi:phytanoyl-CoA dioxygenase family protein [Actinoplanes flavus]|uniref:Phytanoyl-CoA dioxygenase family protein n=1 Tax=Actinoplanes flavus TaxID=2820290 RepID=A0ABS3USG9_9ACTN|nr:phytanoyl-CoA dioxygenase family protein [Actinoplanes flavus]MBO3741527.1 phytanoyl-CoA dioxygenase family protein [Actinoplanes flavus]